MLKKFTSKNNLIHFLFFMILLMLINGRSFLGLYILNFRIGELLTGFSLMLIILFIFNLNYLKSNFNKLPIFYFSIILFFLINVILDLEGTVSLYTFKSAVSIWYISFFFFGFYIFQNFSLSKKYFILGYIGLGVQYLFNVLYYPEFLNKFFNFYSDKTQFLKGSEIAIFFMIVTFFTNRFSKKGIFIDVFVLFSSIYLPLMFFKSRSGGFAVLIFVLFEMYTHRKYFLINLKKTSIVFAISTALFAMSSHYLIDNPVEIEETPKAVAQVFKHKYVVANTYDEEVPLFYFFEDRLFSADGNLNWRLQLWQDIYYSSESLRQTVIGFGFNNQHPVYSQKVYSGLDGLNENAHNYFINLYTRGGIVLLILILIFYYLLLKINRNKQFSTFGFLTFTIPVLIISLFDGSMENPYFGILFYFFLSSFYSGLKFDEERL